MENNNKNKIYDVLSARAYTDNSGEQKTEYYKLGVAFPLKNKNGLNMKLTNFPVSGEIIVLERTERSKKKESTEVPF